ncbi:uncharacterized protein EV420DRAFT_1521574 [Desarmillaria tabescens]|uniref:DUF6534 domain-containing protein n=1 Tax=Armillaria tabescens TaxID=1929756 RepID=A0AA39NC44_ARMTA|nr:uncharacterized protein EV420DRAFT_1521574 [Desarmillaria tabescens]KAK0462910.1 hypothetical protein EV420DRAFT_1521574 [Desarmillaria tabescens]
MSETASTSAPDNTMGALFICTVFQGLTVLCSWEYFVHVLSDSKITACSFIDTLHQVFITHALYMYLVKGFSDPSIMMRLLCFFTWRVWVVSQKNKLLSAIIELLQLTDIAKLLVIGYSTNLLITASLLFMHFRMTAPGEQTNRIVDKFTLWVLNSGLLISLVGVFCFITEAVWPQSLIPAAMYTLLCRSMSHSLSQSAVLNSKKQIGSSSSNMQRSSSEILSNRSRGPRLQVSRPGELAIHVECDTQMQYDNMESPQSHKDGETFELTPYPINK